MYADGFAERLSQKLRARTIVSSILLPSKMIRGPHYEKCDRHDEAGLRTIV
jgi:hypothetical protein